MAPIITLSRSGSIPLIFGPGTGGKRMNISLQKEKQQNENHKTGWNVRKFEQAQLNCLKPKVSYREKKGTIAKKRSYIHRKGEFNERRSGIKYKSFSKDTRHNIKSRQCVSICTQTRTGKVKALAPILVLEILGTISRPVLWEQSALMGTDMTQCKAENNKNTFYVIRKL